MLSLVQIQGRVLDLYLPKERSLFFYQKYILSSTDISVSHFENSLGEDMEIPVETEFYIFIFVITVITFLGILFFMKTFPWLN